MSQPPASSAPRPPIPGFTDLRGLRDRLSRADALLSQMEPLDTVAAARIRGKAEGVRLALSYLAEEMAR